MKKVTLKIIENKESSTISNLGELIDKAFKEYHLCCCIYMVQIVGSIII
jgi:hypothetical protein